MPKRKGTIIVPDYFRDPLAVSSRRSYGKALEFISELEQHKRASDIVDWIARNRWIKNSPWSWENPGGKIDAGEKDDPHPKHVLRDYLFAYLRDDSQEKVAIKPRQAEMSETAINEAAFYACTKGSQISHIFPTDGAADGFSEEKIMPALKDSPGISSMLLRAKIRRYMFHGGGIYSVMGALGRAAGRSPSRDILFFDEYDYMPESIVQAFRDLTSHSQLQLIRYLSTPTVPGVGIDGVAQKGSGNEWVVTCPKCRQDQILKWPDNICNMFEAASHEINDVTYEGKLNKIYIGCAHCGHPFDRNSPEYAKNSRWVAQRPHRQGIFSSYYFTGLMLPWKTGKELARKYHLLQHYIWQFQNDVIGTAYLKGSNRLSEADIRPCHSGWHMTFQRTMTMGTMSLGVDWGETESWVVVSCDGYDPIPARRAIIYLERITKEELIRNGIDPAMPAAHAERVYQIAIKYGVNIIVDDANGIGVDKHKHLMRKLPGRVWGAFFDTTDADKPHDSKLIIPRWEEGRKTVTFSKIIVLKEVQQEFRTQQIAIPADTAEHHETIELFVKSCQNLGIQPRWDMTSEREYEIVSKFGPDHFLDALFYSYIGFHKLKGTYTHGANFVSYGGMIDRMR